MYESHWGLNRRPFDDWDDADTFYPSETHQTASLKLRYGLDCRRAVMLLTGDSGMGKSLVLRRLAERAPEKIGPLVRIGFPQLSADQLLGYVTDKLTGTPGSGSETARQCLGRLEAFLDKNVSAGRHATVVVDEAHQLSGGLPETLRMMLNLGQPGDHAESAWTLILVGQPTLTHLVERHRGLEERVAVKCVLHRFDAGQTSAYLQHRLQAAGGQIERVFTADAVDAIHLRGGGIPRRINRLADLALMVGFAEDLAILDAPQIDGVHQELVGA